MRTDAQLLTAAHRVAEEWVLLATIAQRTAEFRDGSAALEGAMVQAGLLHYRCVVNFCCGDHSGRWHPNDVQPEDFLGRPWWPPYDDFDRLLRGRLQVIDQSFTHLSWERIDPAAVWPFRLLAYEADYALRLFVADLPRDTAWGAVLEAARRRAGDLMPPRESWPATGVAAAPLRPLPPS
jgi:hypothetical protein